MNHPVFEQRLGELVSLLPDLVLNTNQYDVKYNWGNTDVLKRYLTDNPNAYPLVWLLPSKVENNYNEKTCKSRCTIVIAVNSLKLEEFNEFIYNTDFLLINDVIQQNLIKAIHKSSISAFDGLFTTEKETNFLVKLDSKESPIDIWNATFINLEVEFNNNCLRPIIF